MPWRAKDVKKLREKIVKEVVRVEEAWDVYEKVRESYQDRNDAKLDDDSFLDEEVKMDKVIDVSNDIIDQFDGKEEEQGEDEQSIGEDLEVIKHKGINFHD